MSPLISCLLEFGLESCQCSTNGSTRSAVFSKSKGRTEQFPNIQTSLKFRPPRPTSTYCRSKAQRLGGETQCERSHCSGGDASSKSRRLEQKEKQTTAVNFSMKTINVVQQKKMFFTARSIDVLPLPFSRTTLISCGTPNVSLRKATDNQWKRCCVQVQQDHESSLLESVAGVPG